MQHWGDDLELVSFFQLKSDPSNSSSSKSADEVLDVIESEFLDTNGISEEEESQMLNFINTNTKDKVSVAIVLHMVAVLRQLKDLEKEKIREVSYEQVMLGRTVVWSTTKCKRGRF